MRHRVVDDVLPLAEVETVVRHEPTDKAELLLVAAAWLVEDATLVAVASVWPCGSCGAYLIEVRMPFRQTTFTGSPSTNEAAV